MPVRVTQKFRIAEGEDRVQRTYFPGDVITITASCQTALANSWGVEISEEEAEAQDKKEPPKNKAKGAAPKNKAK